MKSKLIYTLLVVLLSYYSHAQNQGYLMPQNSASETALTITQYSLKQGLPQSQVTDIVKQQNGTILLQTSNGIVSFNGYKFTSVIDTSKYTNALYNGLAWHEKSKTLLSIAYVNSVLVRIMPSYKVLGNYTACSIVGDTVYAITQAGELFKASVHTLIFFRTELLSIKYATKIIVTKHCFFVANANGIFAINRVTKQEKKIYDGVKYSLQQNPYNANIYVCEPTRIVEYNQGANVVNIVPTVQNQYNELFFINKTNYYAYNLHTIVTINNNIITPTIRLENYEIYCLYIDTLQRTIYAGTGKKGLLKINYTSCTTLGNTTQLSSALNSVCEFNNQVMILEANGKLHIIKNDLVLPYLNYSNLNIGWASLSCINDTLYVSEENNGIRLIYNKKTIGYIPPKQLQNANCNAVFKDSKAQLWIGTQKGVAKGLWYKTIRPFLTSSIKSDVICFYETTQHKLCIGTTTGVYILNEHDKLIAVLDKTKGVLGREVRGFYEDSLHRIWFGTYGGGLYCYDNGKLTSINNLKNCALNTDVFCIAKDNLGYLYSTSNHGLWRIKESDLVAFYEGKLPYLVPFYYGDEEGIRNIEFNGGFQNNYCKSKSNLLYFPSLEGIIKVKPETLLLQKRSIYIDKVTINDTSIVLKNTFRFSRNTDVINFEFSSPNFSQKNNVYYQYSLQTMALNQPENWSSISKNQSITLKSLLPGAYMFKVRAIDGFNNSSPNVTSYYFEIAPLFYETNWFKTLILFIVLAGIYLVFRHRKKQYLEQIQQEEKIKTTITQLELKAIQAQMNPHFIFNSLNSIKYYLLINDTKNADVFIDNFAQLLRSFMDYSTFDFISIENEIKLLSLYLNLEKMRMNDEFEFEIKSELDKNTLIPTILIQPFVENAIKHGITHSEKKCKLLITFLMHANKIICTIHDDGVGRRVAEQINMRNKYHQSKGINLVKDKIKTINHKYSSDILLNIVDKENDLGTIVILKIPALKT
jgi:sensor histidine kinase YesM